MFEYDDDLKLRSLTVWGFDLVNIDVNKVLHVPMHQYRVSSYDYPMLYTDNLQCCIGFYAYANGFGFLAHINTVVMRGNEFLLDVNKNPIQFNRTDDLLKAILDSGIIFKDKLKIGIILGSSPLNNNHPTIKLINNSIDVLIEELNLMGIKVERIDNIYAPELILDSVNEKIITVDKVKKKVI